MVDESNLDLITFVAVFDPDTASFAFTSDILKKTEQALGKELQGGEGITERGPARILTVPRDQMDMIVESERLEVRRRYPSTDLSPQIDDLSNLFSVGLDLLEGELSSVTWHRFGYNYTMSVPTTGPAVGKLAEGVFSQEYKQNLKYDIIGAANWLWLQVGDAVLWLRLEPHRNDRSTERVTVMANFLEETGPLPTGTTLTSQLLMYWSELKDILGRIGL